jgi:sugar phosphate isomerase/epimerase
MNSRREFIKKSGLIALGGIAAGSIGNNVFGKSISGPEAELTFSLAEFSFAGELYSGKMSNLDFPAITKKEFGINVLEYVSGFFNGKHTDPEYMKELKKRVDDLGMINNLIMVDDASIADLDPEKRNKAVEAHHAWVDAANYLGCKSIRVNLGDTAKAMTGEPDDPAEEAAKSAAEGYHRLLEYAAQYNMNVIVENHFGNSTDIDWLVGVIKAVNMPNAGLLPDFGNFCRRRSKPETNDIKGMLATKCIEQYDPYEGIKKMMPYAKGISAKAHHFDAQGNEPDIDFLRIFRIIKEAGFKGYVGIEYEGGVYKMFDPSSDYLGATEGIKATKALIEKVWKQLA